MRHGAADAARHRPGRRWRRGPTLAARLGQTLGCRVRRGAGQPCRSWRRSVAIAHAKNDATQRRRSLTTAGAGPDTLSYPQPSRRAQRARGRRFVHQHRKGTHEIESRDTLFKHRGQRCNTCPNQLGWDAGERAKRGGYSPMTLQPARSNAYVRPVANACQAAHLWLTGYL